MALGPALRYSLICFSTARSRAKGSTTSCTSPNSYAFVAEKRLPLKKYDKWLCEAKLKSGKSVQFVSVKSMFTVYFHQPYFIKHKFLDSNIEKMYVQDYISGKKVDAKDAVYLFGSRIVGPHGDDLIPFANQESAKLFMLKHGGTKILPFNKLSKGLIKYLDM